MSLTDAICRHRSGYKIRKVVIHVKNVLQVQFFKVLPKKDKLKEDVVFPFAGSAWPTLPQHLKACNSGHAIRFSWRNRAEEMSAVGKRAAVKVSFAPAPIIPKLLPFMND